MKEHYTAVQTEDGRCRISTALGGKNRIYWSKDAFGFTDDNEFEPFEQTTVADNPLGDRRCYYHLFSETGGYTVAAPRVLIPNGRINTRDLGGYNAADGRFFVQSGLLYRSADLAALDERQFALLKSLNLSAVVDFRQPAEIQKRPNPELPGAKTINLTPLLDSGEMKHIAVSSEYLKSLRDEDAAEIYRYVDSVYTTAAIKNAAYRQFFEMLLDQKNTPLLFHCVAGKDRTGIAAALILLALGIPRETVIEDYVQSKEARRFVVDQYRDLLSQTLSAQHATRISRLIFGVERQSIERMFFAVQARYGSWEDYFSRDIGLSAAAVHELRSLYLVPHFMRDLQ